MPPVARVGGREEAFPVLVFLTLSFLGGGPLAVIAPSAALAVILVVCVPPVGRNRGFVHSCSSGGAVPTAALAADEDAIAKPRWTQGDGAVRGEMADGLRGVKWANLFLCGWMGHGPIPDPRRRDGSIPSVAKGGESRSELYEKGEGGDAPAGGRARGACGLFAPICVSSERAALKGRVSRPPVDAHVDSDPEGGDRAP